MLQDAHEKTESIVVDISSSGDNVVVAGDTNSEYYVYIHELIGAPDADVTLTIKAGTRELAEFDLKEGQGLTEDDIPGHDGVPRFRCRPGEDFILNLSGAVGFKGSCVHSKRY